MTKNETIITKWLEPNSTIEELEMDYETPHEEWVKFRDLKIEDHSNRIKHYRLIKRISKKICHHPISVAFDELVKGIEWYNNLTK